ncbi:vitamin D 25-hydroxylase-like [Clavelina lepadiformis]|uniref:vitamin D 25-hydroxylase-like n=1 Tax=Clavelina lepadiformis TaxID=159417 RepID=UPI0040416852
MCFQRLTYVVEMIVEASIVCFTSILLLYGIMAWYRRPPNSPPGPRGVPIFGNAFFLGKEPQKTFRDWGKKYGKVLSVRLGSNDWILVNDYATLHQALVKQLTRFSGIPACPILMEFSNRNNGLAFVDHAPSWQTHRRHIVTTLRRFELGKRSMETKISNEASQLIEFLRSANEQAVDIGDLLHKMTTNILCHGIFGKRYEYEHPTLCSLVEMITKMVSAEFGESMQTALLFPWLRFIPPVSSGCDKILHTRKRMIDAIDEVVVEHEKSYDEDDMRDFIDCYLKEMKAGKELFTRKQLLYEVSDLFLGGTDTTSNTLKWCLHAFLHYPQTQSKLRKEIFDVLGPSGNVNMSHEPKMPYTQAFIYEILRFHPILGLIYRSTTEDTELEGYSVPKGTPVIFNLWAVLMDPDYWHEPDKFNPDRFINEKRNFFKPSYAVPFNMGGRQCPGERLARMELFIYLVTMVQRFEILPDPDAAELPSTDWIIGGGIFFSPPSFKVVFKEI